MLTSVESECSRRGMSNVLSETKQQQVIALGRLGWSLRRIEKETGIRRETVGAYLKAADLPVRPPGRWGHPVPESQAPPQSTLGSKPAKQVSTDSCSKTAIENKGVSTDAQFGENHVPTSIVNHSASVCEPYRDLIEAALQEGRNAMAIWQDLVEQHGFQSRYACVSRFVRKLKHAQSLEGCGTIETPPGQEAQVDYGAGPLVRDPNTGKYRRTRLFVLTLGYSRKSVRLLVFKSSTQIWAELHEQAFRRLGGVPQLIVLDNLREGVFKPDIYDPELNPLFRDFLKYYGSTALPCRVRDPDRKGKVESGVGHAKRTPLKGMKFENLEEAQAYLDRWEEHWADTRIHGTTKRQVAAMFAEERPFLKQLPLEPFRYYKFGKRTVHLDGCVEVDKAYYAPPLGYIGSRLLVQWDDRHVRILHPKTHELLREHIKKPPGRRSVLPQDKPKRTPPSTLNLLGRAAKAGANIGVLCKRVHDVEGEAGIRRIQGVLSLGKKYGQAALEQACKIALECEVPSYRFVRRYLERQPSGHLTLRQVDPLIRQLTLYRDLFHQRTQGEEK
jgi:transposase